MVTVMGIAAVVIPLFAIVVFRRVGDRGDLLYESSSLMGPADARHGERPRVHALPGRSDWPEAPAVHAPARERPRAA